MANNLDACVAEADERGISYGKLMVDREPQQTAAEKSEKPERSAPLKILTCGYCGKEFPVYDKRNHVYCSEECRQAAQMQRAKEKKAERQEDKNMGDGKFVTCVEIAYKILRDLQENGGDADQAINDALLVLEYGREEKK